LRSLPAENGEGEEEYEVRRKRLLDSASDEPVPARPLQTRDCLRGTKLTRTAKLTSPGDDYNPATLSMRIDKRPPIPWPHKESVKIGDLDVGERHLVVLTSDGKRIKSFWLRFKDYETTDLCIHFDGYQGVQVEDQKSSPWCKCK
jgi:hypothetical protein